MTSTAQKNMFFFAVLGALMIIFSIWVFSATRRYDRKRTKLYSFFMDMNRRDALIVAASTLAFATVVYYAVSVDSFDFFGMCLILAAELFPMLFSFNWRIILMDLLSAIISVVALELLLLTKTYVSEVYDDVMVRILVILGTIALVIFASLMCLRKIEIILKRNKFIRRSDDQ